MSASPHFLQSSPQDLKRALEDVNRKMMEEEAHNKAAVLGLPYIDLHNFPVDLNVLGIFSEEEAKQAQALPFYKDITDLRIAVLEPKNPLLLEKVRELSKKNKVSLYIASKASFDQTLRFYSKVITPKALHDEVLRVQKELNYPEIFKQLEDETQQQKKSAGELLEIFFGASISYKSSDIHFEPEEHFMKLRFRIDGVLQDMLHISKQLQKQLIVRIKILAKLKLNVENAAQDGRITFYYLGKPVDVRVSILPSAYGEELVLRLLGTEALNLKVKDLGFQGQALAAVQRALLKTTGAIITTGPTGSGKTTSLYAFLNELNVPGVKIITLEDPIEYKLEGIVQTPIDHNVDFDFAKGLRAILRQDPDIVMVGEIRDQETAEVSMQAALTGHLVLSTLHTNDAAGAVPRLANMGVKPFVLAPALSVIIAQRLVRRICQNCKVAAKLSPAVLEKIQRELKQLPKTEAEKLPKHLGFYHSPGCKECHNLGYKGRIGIYEVLEVTEAIQKLIMDEGSFMTQYKKAAAAQGMVTMLQDGFLKALQGITDVEEVFRVAGD